MKYFEYSSICSWFTAFDGQRTLTNKESTKHLRDCKYLGCVIRHFETDMSKNEFLIFLQNPFLPDFLHHRTEHCLFPLLHCFLRFRLPDIPALSSLYIKILFLPQGPVRISPCFSKVFHDQPRLERHLLLTSECPRQPLSMQSASQKNLGSHPWSLPELCSFCHILHSSHQSFWSSLPLKYIQSPIAAHHFRSFDLLRATLGVLQWMLAGFLSSVYVSTPTTFSNTCKHTSQSVHLKICQIISSLKLP